MPRVWYMFFIILILFAALFLIFIMFANHSNSHLTAMDLQQAVTDDLQLSRDDSARMEKGVYAVNQSKFENNLKWSNGHKPKILIKNLNDTKETNNHAPYYFVIRFLNDDGSNEDIDNNSNNRGYNSNYQSNIGSNSSIRAIRGVQVIAIPYKVIHSQNLTSAKDILNKLSEQQSSNSSSSSNSSASILNNKKYVSTIIIQEFDKDSTYKIKSDKNKIPTAQSNHTLNHFLYDSANTHEENNNKNMTDLTDND